MCAACPAHQPRQLPHRQSGLGDGARHRRARHGRGQVLGLSGHAAACRPTSDRCLVILSDGGRDANVRARVRPARAPLRRGRLRLPEGKQSVAWEDEDTILVAPRLGPGDDDRIGLSVRRQAPAARPERSTRPWRSIAAQPEDVGAGAVRAARQRRPGRTASVAYRGIDVFHSQFILFRPGGNVTLNHPAARRSLAGIVDGRLLVTLERALAGAGPGRASRPIRSSPTISRNGSAIRSRRGRAWSGRPAPRQTLSGIATTQRQAARQPSSTMSAAAPSRYDYVGGDWRSSEIALPRNATIGIAAASDQRRPGDVQRHRLSDPDDALVSTTARPASSRRIKTTPPRFDASRHVVEQLEATSRDGTQHPLFPDPAARRCARTARRRPCSTAMAASRSVQVPNYSGTMGRLWLEQGNAYVVANLRGGGEFGPEWHQSAQVANKQRTWDDYIAVAEDLIRRRITSPAPARRGRRKPGRPARRHRDHPAAGAVQRGDHPGAAVRHAALPSDRRRRVLDRRIWRSAHPRAAGLARGLFALPEADAGA